VNEGREWREIIEQGKGKAGVAKTWQAGSTYKKKLRQYRPTFT